MAEKDISPNATSWLLSRGEIYINERYVGNSPKMQIVYKSALRAYRIYFTTENINLENIELFFGGKQRVDFQYKSFNPVGKQFDFQVTGELMPTDFPFKGSDGNDWQSLNFMLTFHGKPEINQRES